MLKPTVDAVKAKLAEAVPQRRQRESNWPDLRRNDDGGQVQLYTWKLLLESVMMVGIAVSTAHPSGLWGLLKESFAGGAELAAVKTDPTAKPLNKAVVGDFETSQGRTTARDGLVEKLRGLKPAEVTAKCIETLGQAGALVDEKAPDDAAAFKAWLRQISQHVAEAASERGLFSSGGSPVSDKEKATLQEISSVLKLAA